MLSLIDVPVPSLRLQRLEPIVGSARLAELLAVARAVRGVLAGRTVWNINSTSSGGGVAEMLQVLVGYATGAGVSTRWSAIEGDEQFFVVTKRVHRWLHGADSDG